MTARAHKVPAAAARVSEIRTSDGRFDDRAWTFFVGGIKVEITSDTDCSAAAALAAQLHAICSIPPAPPRIEAAPIIKFAGGKTKLLPDLLPRMPLRFHRYYEPFAGGAALFFRVAPERAVLGDVNADLINMYRQVAAETEFVISVLANHWRRHGKAHYYATRDQWNTDRNWDPRCRAAAFIYLNKTCFNGLWRVNRAGAFNVPIGRYTDPPICVPDALRAAARVLRRSELRCGDFLETLADAQRGDFVYLDSPYDPVTSTANFTAYASRGFSADDQVRLAETVRALASRGVMVMASNADTPLVRRLYAGLRIDTVKCRRSINRDSDGRGAVDEVIVMAGYEPARGA